MMTIFNSEAACLKIIPQQLACFALLSDLFDLRLPLLIAELSSLTARDDNSNGHTLESQLKHKLKYKYKIIYHWKQVILSQIS